MRFQVVGAPRWLAPDGTATGVEKKDAALMAFLAIEGPQPRGRIATLLWPQVPADKARNSLRQRIYRLKRATGRDVVLGSDLLHVAPDCVERDARPLDRLTADPDALQGPLLGGLNFDDEPAFAEWLETQRQRWRSACHDALAALADAHEAEQRLAAALRYASRLVAEDPLLEHAHRRVMRLHFQRGDDTAALAAYRHCAATLQAAFGIRPSAETESLRALVDGSQQAAPARPTHAPPPSRVLPPSLRRPPQLVARGAEWQQLHDALISEQVVLLEGEAGVGKTRLLQQFAQAQGWPEPVSARPGDEAVPYALAARWLARMVGHAGPPEEAQVLQDLARLVPGLAAADPPAASVLEPARLLQAVEAALRAWRHRLGAAPSAALRGVVLDDLQFADTTSLDLLLNLAGAGRQMGVHWVLALRPVPRPEPLSRWCEHMDAQRLRTLSLQPLDEAGVAALLESLRLPGLKPEAWAPALLAHCGGRPFFVVDTLAGLHVGGVRDFSSLPAFAEHAAHRRATMSERFKRLEADEQQLIHVAAVAGEDFSVELGAAVLACSPAALAGPWRALELAGVFGGQNFAHDLVRQAALDAMPQPVMRSLHRQIAQWLEGPGAAAAGLAARTAAHWEAAQAWREAARSFALAAQEAHLHSAKREELHALEAAARCHRLCGDTRHDDAAFDCEWRALHVRLPLESSDEVLALTEALLARAGTDLQRACALELRAHVHNERLAADRALADAREAAALARRAGAARLQALAAQRVGIALMRLQQQAEAVRSFEDHIEFRAALNAEEQLFWLSDHATALDYADRRSQAITVFQAAVAEAERQQQWGAASEAWGNQSVALIYLNRLEESVHASRQAIACGRRAGAERGNILIDEMTLAASLRDLGQWDVYLQRAPALPQELRAAGYEAWASNAENDLAICYAWLGRTDLGLQTLTPLGDGMPSTMQAARQFTLARLKQWRAGPGDPARFVEHVKQALALLDGTNGVSRSYVRLRIALEAARTVAEPGQALAQVLAIEHEARDREQFMLATQGLTLRVQLLLSMGDAAAAAVAGRQLLAQCLHDGPVGSQYAPEVWWAAARALQDTDRDTARLALGHARDWIEGTLLPRVPEVFRHSFLQRNAVNVAVLKAAREQRLC